MTHEDDSDLYGISGTQCGNDEVLKAGEKDMKTVHTVRIPANYWRQTSEYRYDYIS